MRILKQFLLMMFVGLVAVGELSAQAAHKVVGVVKDAKGEPLIGVQIVPVGAVQSGTITDFDGNYVVNVPKGITKLQYSYIGYGTQTIDINGRNKIDVVLTEEAQTIETVVVTALGIKRKSKTLTYATQSVDNKELTRIKEPNFVNALRGKSAGLTITPNNSGAGGGATKITLRGQNSILGSNQPLIVLDGVPLSSGPQGQAESSLVRGNTRDGGDILSTINPDDIASLTVLKGPNAAALYGSSANNGVLIITTKSGREGKVRVDVSSSTMADVISIYPELQTRYGLGASLDGWGKRIDQMTDDEVYSTPYLSRNPKNNIKDFFNVGLTQNTSVTMSGGTEKSKSYFSYANTLQTGVVPKNKFMRHNVMFKQSYDLYDRISLDLGVNYIHQNTQNRPVNGIGLNPMTTLYRMPRVIDINYFRHNYEHPGTLNDIVVIDKEKGNRKLVGLPVQTWFWTGEFQNNPYWLLERMNNEAIQDRILATLSSKVKIIDDLNFQTRTNVDYIQNKTFDSRYASTNTAAFDKGGKYYTGRSHSSDFFQDALFSYNKELSKSILLQANLGGSYKRSYNRSLAADNNIDTAGIPNKFIPQNNKKVDNKNSDGVSTSTSESWGDNWEAALFATATLGWDDKIFVDGSYRVEWAKSFQQFSQGNKYISFDFYSLGANAQLDKLFNLGKQINNLKLRSSFSVVGNPIPNRVFAARTIDLRTGSLNVVAPKFENPRPETTTSFEVGLDGALFGNKWDFDITFYNSTLKNQFLELSGASSQRVPINTGKIRNWGIEFSTNYRFDLPKKITWRTGFNIAYNDNKILETYTLPNGTEFVYTTGPQEFKIKYLKGGAFGDIYVNTFAYDDKGHIRLNPNGSPQLESGEYLHKLGNATARINFGLNNTVSYKDFQLYFLIDGKIGGKVMSFTQADMDRYGVSERSADARDAGGVILPDGSGRKVDTKAYYEVVGAFPNEDYVYDATNFRLREISLGYTFYDLLGQSKNLQLSLLARNLFFLYKNSPVDPDISQSAANGFGGIDVYALPTTRTFGVSAKITF